MEVEEAQVVQVQVPEADHTVAMEEEVQRPVLQSG